MSDTESEEPLDEEPPEADEEAAGEETAGGEADEEATTGADGAATGDEGDADEDGGEPADAADAAAGSDALEETTDEDAIAERVADRDPETVAREIAALREENETLEAEREDLESRLKRKQAEFQNYKKRQKKRREQERERATEDLVERLLEVRDNLKRALEQDEDADIREGVEATFRQLDEILREENVDPIEPDPGTEVDPQRHEVLLRVDSDRPAGTVAEVHRPGYEMADKVLRAAQVTVSEGAESDDE